MKIEIYDTRKWSNYLVLCYKNYIDNSELYTELQCFKFQSSKLLISFISATLFYKFYTLTFFTRSVPKYGKMH